MTRAPIPPTTQAAVLLRARRRCCICFGLNRDTSIKQGQIAHLDRNSANGAEDNLAFLCFDHHDQYDSATSQSKNLTELEVKGFRDELHTAIRMAFDRDVAFGEARVALDPISGHYIRGGVSDSAELKIQGLSDGRYHVSGLALHGKEREHGPNIGELDFIGELQGKTLKYSASYFAGEEYRVALAFRGDRLTVSEENWFGVYGVGVTFNGIYEKAT